MVRFLSLNCCLVVSTLFRFSVLIATASFLIEMQRKMRHPFLGSANERLGLHGRPNTWQLLLRLPRFPCNLSMHGYL